ncbi:MAG: hypothetical protein SVY53_00225 [Chloroflexota bacterium]|nr:hypothetical protein [Chloroflexota bacterium]
MKSREVHKPKPLVQSSATSVTFEIVVKVSIAVEGMVSHYVVD